MKSCVSPLLLASLYAFVAASTACDAASPGDDDSSTDPSVEETSGSPSDPPADETSGSPGGDSDGDAPSDTEEPPRVVSDSLDERLFFGDFTSSIWTADGFDGGVYRSFGGSWLWVDVQQTSKGGMDTSIGNGYFADRASAISREHAVHGKLTLYETSPGGRWWYGPKISVNWDPAGDRHGAAGWYENYIIDNASDTPEQFHESLTGDFFRGELVATTYQDGAEYKHYLVPFQTWHQFWSIRQTYRDEGWTNVGEIVHTWLDHGLPDERLDGIKYNLETHEPQHLQFMISHVQL